MNVIISILVTTGALGVSVLTLNLYKLFLIKHHILKSIWQVPLIFFGCFVCIVFFIFVPMAIIDILLYIHLPKLYHTVSLCGWGIANLGYTAYSFLYKPRRG
jgi:hypothetical protein